MRAAISVCEKGHLPQGGLMAVHFTVLAAGLRISPSGKIPLDFIWAVSVSYPLDISQAVIPLVIIRDGMGWDFSQLGRVAPPLTRMA